MHRRLAGRAAMVSRFLQSLCLENGTSETEREAGRHGGPAEPSCAPTPNPTGWRIGSEIRLEAGFKESAGAGDAALDCFGTQTQDVGDLGVGELFQRGEDHRRP